MIYKQIVETTEREHGIRGIGKIKRVGEFGNGSFSFKVSGDKIPDIVYTGDEAKKLIIDTFAVDENNFSIESKLIKSACIACGVDFNKFSEKTRKKDVVFARYLAAWYSVTTLKKDFEYATEITGLDRATIYHAVKKISPINMSQFSERAVKKDRFIKLMKLP